MQCDVFGENGEFHFTFRVLYFVIFVTYVAMSLTQNIFMLFKVSGGSRGTKNVSYSYFIAFISLLNNMELLRQIVTTATNERSQFEMTKGVLFTGREF